MKNDRDVTKLTLIKKIDLMAVKKLMPHTNLGFDAEVAEKF